MTAALRNPLVPVAAGWAAAVTAVAVVGGLATDTSSDWYVNLEKPSWQPPGAVFGPVWTVLYVLIAIAATLAYRDVGGPRRRLVMGLFAANLASTSPRLDLLPGHAPKAAGVEILFLLATIVALIRLVWPHNRAAAAALAPYGAWTAFATALTWTIAASTSDANRRRPTRGESAAAARTFHYAPWRCIGRSLAPAKLGGACQRRPMLGISTG